MKSMMLNTSNTPKKLLKKYFNYDDFRVNQKEVINSIVNSSNNTLVIMPTGGGKSILYTIPALLFNGVTIIVSPLIALMQDQVLNLKSRNINAEYISSETNNFNNIKEHIEDIKIIFVSPERFVNESFFLWLKTIDNSFIALDEAHTFTEYGLSFRASYRLFFIKLIELQKERNIKFLALTATASDFIYKDLTKNYNFNKIFKFDIFRDNLEIKISIFETNKEKNKNLYSKLDNIYEKNKTCLIYTLSRREAEKIYYRNGERLKKLRYYHSKLPSKEKEKLLKGFLKDEIKIIASTTAFGMGIDKSDVRYVFHSQLPTSVEDYSQQIGRAGRDGKLSFVEMFISQEDIAERKKRILNNKENLKKDLDSLKKGIISTDESIKNIFLIRNLITPIKNPQLNIKIINNSTPYPFLIKLLKLLKDNNTSINILSKKLEVNSWIIEDALSYLKDRKNIDFNIKKYKINEFDFDTELKYLFEDDNIKIEKFNSLINYIETKKCRHKYLSKYFLNEIEDCGNICDNCKAEDD